MPIFPGLQGTISSINLQIARDTMIPHRTVREIPLGNLQPVEPPVAIKLHARVVEFIAKPEKTDELRGLLRQVVTPLLRDRSGFIRSVVLTTHEEQRRVVVITFWSTEEHTVRDPWEETPRARELFSPLIDALSRTRTCKVDVTEATEARSQAISLPIC
jgi:heme-degrading monooxygenase HmoA